MNSKIVFLDRDGVINKKRNDYVKSWNEFQFLYGVQDALKIFINYGYKIIIITNQSVINRKIIDEEDLKNIHEKMIIELNKDDIEIDAIYYCPHTPDENCECRKPKTGLLKKASEKFDFIPHDCILIGDSITDIQAGKSFGLKTYLLKKENNLLELTKNILDIKS
tara:strand:- start:582 stop:1076 length:495 start_codon:yes stop_codon:yes gene_type:complete